MGRYTVARLFEMDELFAGMDAVRWKRREERLLQFSAVKANARHIREIGGHTREHAAYGSVAHGCSDDRASTHHLLHQAQMLQHANGICRKPDAGADFLQLGGALEHLDANTRLPQSNGSSKSAYTRADDENFRLCRHTGDRSIARVMSQLTINSPMLAERPRSQHSVQRIFGSPHGRHSKTQNGYFVPGAMNSTSRPTACFPAISGKTLYLPSPNPPPVYGISVLARFQRKTPTVFVADFPNKASSIHSSYSSSCSSTKEARISTSAMAIPPRSTPMAPADVPSETTVSCGRTRMREMRLSSP